MAIDSADKRKSAVNWLRRILPIPDGLISIGDRIHVAGFFRDIIRFLPYNIGLLADVIFKKLDIDVVFNSDSLLKKLDITKVISSDSLLKKLDVIKGINSDLLIRKVDHIVSTTIDIIIERKILREILYLKSYINTAENNDSTIRVSINIDSNISKVVSKFSETDSDISISRYSIINLT